MARGGPGIGRRGFLGGMAAAGLVSCAPGQLSAPGPLAAPAVRTGPAGPLRLAFYTDVHARVEWDTPLAMMRAAGAINDLRPDFVLAGGDLVTDGFQRGAAAMVPRWDAYMEMHRSIEREIFPAIGNHDLVAAIPDDGSPAAADPRAVWRRRLGRGSTWYSFDAGGYHFVMLDSVEVTGGEYLYRGHIGAAQLDWLRTDLGRLAPGAPVVAVLHIPLLTTFYSATAGAAVAAPPNRVVVNNVEVLEAFAGHDLVLVLQGHLHVEERLRWRNTTFITGGAVSGRWWRGPWHGTGEGFGLLTLSGGEVGWTYIDYGWQARRPDGV